MHKPLKVVVLTGAATGIGAACAREFAAHGWQVALSYLDDATHVAVLEVAAACEALGAGTLVQHLDVAQDADCHAFAAAALARWGRIDALVNCAGTTRFIPHADLDALDPAEFHRTYDVNTVGLYRMTRACVPALQASGGGSVVNISSIGGVIGRGSSMAYAASKGGVVGMTFPIARDLARNGIRNMTIAPGIFGTPMLFGMPQEVQDALAAGVPFPSRLGNPQDYAKLAKHIIENDMLNGEVIRLDGAIRLAPK